MKLHNHVFTTSHIIGTTTFLFFFQSEAKRYAGADVKQRKRKGWPNNVISGTTQKYVISRVMIVTGPPSLVDNLWAIEKVIL